MSVVIRTLTDGEGLSIGDNITLTLKFPSKGGRRVVAKVDVPSGCAVRPLPCGRDRDRQPQRDSQLRESERE